MWNQSVGVRTRIQHDEDHLRQGDSPQRPRSRPAARPIVAQLSEALCKVLAQPDLLENFAKQGAAAEWSSPADLGQQLSSEVRQWASVAKDAGLKPE